MNDDHDSGPSQSEKTKGPPSRGKQVALLGGALGLVGLVSIGLYQLWSYERIHPSTDDAYLQAHYVWISPQLNGQVARLFVEPNQFVKAGEPLFEIDPRPFQHDLVKAENQLLLVRHDVEASKDRVESARARLSALQAEIKTAQQYADRFQEMVKTGAAAELDTIHYINALTEGKARAAEAKANLEEANILGKLVPSRGASRSDPPRVFTFSPADRDRRRQCGCRRVVAASDGISSRYTDLHPYHGSVDADRPLWNTVDVFLKTKSAAAVAGH